MVTLEYLKKYFVGKKVFLTGHTGFKGSWLLQILSLLEADVKGFSLAPENEPDLFFQLEGEKLCKSHSINDIRDKEKLRKEIINFEPDIIIHMAAQPLVLEGYKEPLYTFEVNSQGTANVLDAIRYYNKKCIVLCITTDKVYENNDVNIPFTEFDKLGGYDPYSASKAAAEIIIASYRNSFFNPEKYQDHLKSIASVRAGNVIGGGDYADNRLLPDIIKSINNHKPLILRNPNATRPWQHVLEPLGAYLLLISKMIDQPEKYCTAYNIAPLASDSIAVEEIAKIAIQKIGKGIIEIEQNEHKVHEASSLSLDITKIRNDIGWEPIFNSSKAVSKTIDWYLDNRNASEKCIEQINDYFK